MGQTVQTAGQPAVRSAEAAIPEVGDLSDQVMRVLTSYRSEVLAGWVWLVEQQPPLPRGWPRLCLSDVLGEPPVLLEVIVGALRAGSAGEFLATSPDTADRLCCQIAFRLVQGAPLTAVLNEQALLRDTVWALFTRRLPAGYRPAELFALARALDGALQRVFELAVLTVAEHPAPHAELSAA